MKRLDLKTGFLCNNNCFFCVQADNKLIGNRDINELKKDLIDSVERCDGVVFTGGEVTIRKDFLELVKFAKELGYKDIQIQTNGRMFSDLDFCKKTISAGANNFAIALHGYNAEQHDMLTRAPGSFDQVIRGINNLKALDGSIITNTVINKVNYRDLPKIADLLVRLDVDQFQFAFIHAMGNAFKNINVLMPKMGDAITYIKQGLDIGLKANKKVMVEAIPYCMMEGYEEFLAERIIPDTEIRGKEWQNTNDFTKQRKESGKTKFVQCSKCKYFNICEGPWKEYPDKFGSDEFKPVLDNSGGSE